MRCRSDSLSGTLEDLLHKKHEFLFAGLYDGDKETGRERVPANSVAGESPKRIEGLIPSYQALGFGADEIPFHSSFDSIPSLLLSQGSEKGAGTNSQMARRVLHTIGSRPLF